MHEGNMLDYKLMDVVKAANTDQHCQCILQALKDRDKPNQLQPHHPAQRFRKQLNHLSIYNGPNGHLILFEKTRTLVPDNAIDNTLKQFHYMHSTCTSTGTQHKER